jgi:HlyD family secretion protein
MKTFKKVYKTILLMFVLGGLIITVFGCGAKSDETVTNLVVTVKRGNLTLDITAAGNLAFSHSEDLAVDLFYPSGTKGTIGEVLVQEGDYVEEGQVLVTIDQSEWDNQLATLEDQVVAMEDQVTSAERGILQAQISLRNAEQALTNAKDTVTAREMAVLSAEISYEQAQSALAASIGTVDVDAALAELRKAQTWYDFVTTTYKTLPTTDPDDYLLVLELAEERLAVAQTNYDNILAGYDSEAITIKKMQVQIAKYNLDAAKQAVIYANDDVTLKDMSLELSQGSLQDAQKSLNDAQQNVDDAQQSLANAQAMSPEIVAPIDGFITQVNVAGGDEVLNGAVAVTIADPDKFEADILVSEMDINDVKLNGAATVTADALTGIAFPAKVTHIAPTATIQSGVVNYMVRVELDEIVTGNQTARATGNAGTLPPEGFVPSGNFTLPEGFTPSGNFTPPQGTEFPAFSSGQSQSQIPSTISGDFQLREGLTVTVSIIVDSRTDVLLVPNGAVTTEGAQSYVQVVSASGEIEKRAVETGLSNWEYTEITDGLSEGEQVEVALNASTTSSSSTQRQGGVGIFGPVP